MLCPKPVCSGDNMTQYSSLQDSKNFDDEGRYVGPGAVQPELEAFNTYTMIAPTLYAKRRRECGTEISSFIQDIKDHVATWPKGTTLETAVSFPAFKQFTERFNAYDDFMKLTIHSDVLKPFQCTFKEITVVVRYFHQLAASMVLDALAASTGQRYVDEYNKIIDDEVNAKLAKGEYEPNDGV